MKSYNIFQVCRFSKSHTFFGWIIIKDKNMNINHLKTSLTSWKEPILLRWNVTPRDSNLGITPNQIYIMSSREPILISLFTFLLHYSSCWKSCVYFVGRIIIYSQVTKSAVSLLNQQNNISDNNQVHPFIAVLYYHGKSLESSVNHSPVRHPR